MHVVHNKYTVALHMHYVTYTVYFIQHIMAHNSDNIIEVRSRYPTTHQIEINGAATLLVFYYPQLAMIKSRTSLHQYHVQSYTEKFNRLQSFHHFEYLIQFVPW